MHFILGRSPFQISPIFDKNNPFMPNSVPGPDGSPALLPMRLFCSPAPIRSMTGLPRDLTETPDRIRTLAAWPFCRGTGVDTCRGLEKFVAEM